MLEPHRRRAGAVVGRLMAATARCGLWLAITLALAEGTLQIAALFVHDRAESRRGAKHAVLCVGDSHTYGVLVGRDESYPAQLQRLLDERSPGAYAVINLGVPGMNTAEVRSRLPVQAMRYRPDVVLIWAGINDFWNHTELGPSAGWPTIDGLASHLRLYRLVRVWLHDRKLERALAGVTGEGVVSGAGVGTGGTFVVAEGGRIERLTHSQGDARTNQAMDEEAGHNYEGMAQWSRAAGVPLIFITYPISLSKFAVANRAMQRVALRYGVTLLDSPKVMPRVPPEERKVLWGGHPRASVYREIARDLVPLVIAAAEGRGAETGGRE